MIYLGIRISPLNLERLTQRVSSSFWKVLHATNSNSLKIPMLTGHNIVLISSTIHRDMYIFRGLHDTLSIDKGRNSWSSIVSAMLTPTEHIENTLKVSYSQTPIIQLGYASIWNILNRYIHAVSITHCKRNHTSHNRLYFSWGKVKGR